MDQKKSVLSELNIPGSDAREGVRNNGTGVPRSCHHTSRAVQAEPADSVKSVEAAFNTEYSYCAK